MLEEKLGFQTIPTTGGTPVNFACPHCKRVAHSEIPFRAGQLEIAEGSKYPDDVGPCEILLDCDRNKCEEKTVILGAVKYGKDGPLVHPLIRVLQLGTGVTCQAGHTQKALGELFRFRTFLENPRSANNG
jgi:hypothetical protein